MESIQEICDQDVTVVRYPERILHDGRRMAAASITTTPVGNPGIVPYSLEAGLEEVGAPTTISKVGNPHDGLSKRPVSEESPDLSIQSTQPAHQHGLRIHCTNK